MDTVNVAESDGVEFEIRGLGHHISIVIPASSTVSMLKGRIGSQIGLLPHYQRLIIRGKTLKDEMPLQQLKIKPGSALKGILMHSPAYKADKEGLEKIANINKELDRLELHGKGEHENEKTITKEAADHMITDICCRLDLIEVNDSDTLRKMRRDALHRAERLGKLWDHFKS